MKKKNNPTADTAELRRQAGERLKKRQRERMPAEPETETPRIIQELQIHQIELEMQNEELRKSRAEAETLLGKYTDLYDLAPVGYCTLSEKGLILEANLAAADLLGAARGALVKQPLVRFILHEDQAIFSKRCKPLLEPDAPQVCELQMMKKDGTTFWANLTAKAAQDNKGEPICRLAISNITARKQLENSLERQTHDLGERIKELNCLYRISDLSETSGDSIEMLIQGVVELLPPAWQYPSITGARITLDGQTYSTTNFELTPWLQRRPIIARDTQIGSVEVCYLEARPDSDEGPFLWQEGRLLDVIAERLGKRVTRIQTQQALQASEKRLQLAINAMREGLWEWDIQTNQEFFSPRWCEIIGYSFDDPELPHSYDSWASRIHPDDHDRVMNALRNHLEKGTEYDVDYRHRHKSDGYRWQNSKGQAVLDASGKPIKMVGCISDITDRKQMEDAYSFLLQCGYPGSGEDFFESLAKYLAQSLDMDYVCIDRLEGDGLTAQTLAIYNDGKFDTNVTYALKETPCGDVVGKTICCFLQDVCRLFPRDAALQDLKAESYVGTTLWSFDMKPIGLIAVIGRKPLKYPALAQATLKLVSIRAAGELERLLAEEKLRKAHDELEQQVEERTVELKMALSEIKSMKDQLEAENIYFRYESKMKYQFEHILGKSNALKYVLYRAEQVASTNTTVLILGETGTGKELIASAIHDMSPRKDRPLITVNCAALPGNLIESELFGREKGAFTGADTRQVGRFEIANGSTLCLDEIGELPLELQAKLLRVIQHNEFERLGSSSTVKVDVRIVATTNRNLEEEVRKGRFRQDLYYRLNVFPITAPPLRQRKEDIPLMVQAFIERFSRKLGKQITSIPKETMKTLQDYPWPGNVRELENVIERAVILCHGPVLQLADTLDISAPLPSSAIRSLEETERSQILKILSETRWRIQGKDGAAWILGIHPSTLRARMQKLGIVRPKTKESD